MAWNWNLEKNPGASWARTPGIQPSSAPLTRIERTFILIEAFRRAAHTLDSRLAASTGLIGRPPAWLNFGFRTGAAKSLLSLAAAPHLVRFSGDGPAGEPAYLDSLSPVPETLVPKA